MGWHWLKRYGNCLPWVWLSLSQHLLYWGWFITYSLSSHWSAVHSAVVLYVIFVDTEEPVFKLFGSGIWRADPMTGCFGFTLYCIKVNWLSLLKRIYKDTNGNGSSINFDGTDIQIASIEAGHEQIVNLRFFFSINPSLHHCIDAIFPNCEIVRCGSTDDLECKINMPVKGYMLRWYLQVVGLGGGVWVCHDDAEIQVVHCSLFNPWSRLFGSRYYYYSYLSFYFFFSLLLL